MSMKSEIELAEESLHSRAARLFAYVQRMQGVVIDIDVIRESKGELLPTGRTSNRLRSALEAMTAKQGDEIVYNAHSRESRDLANWWDDFREMINAKVATERKERMKRRLVARAMSKLSRVERAALGLL